MNTCNKYTKTPNTTTTTTTTTDDDAPGEVRQGVITATLTPSQAEETFADESGPHLARDSHVGLPRLRQDPAERGQEKEVQKGCCHRADTLLRHMESSH